MPVKLIFEDFMQRAGYIVRQLQESLSICEDLVHKKNNLRTRQYGVLAAIQSIPDPVTPTDVAKWLNRKTNSTTLMIDRMEKEGLIRRVRDLNDRRSLRLEITEKGVEKVKRGNKSQKKLFKEIMSCLTPEELEEFVRLSEKILEKTFEIRELKGNVKEIKVQ